MPIAPDFPRIGAGFAAALFYGALISTARRMRFNFVWLAPDDVDAAAIGLPAGNAGRKALVSVRKAAVVLFLGGVDWRFRIGVAALPEKLRELVAFLVGRELQK